MPNNPRDFKSDSYQIGNLIRALTESSDGDLVFRDEFYPGGVRLRDLLTSSGRGTYTTVAAISAYLDMKIEINTTNIAALSAHAASNSALIAVSGYLQDQIWSNDEDIEDLRFDLDSLATGISATGSYATRIGNGIDTTFNVQHDLNETYVDVNVYEFASGNEVNPFLRVLDSNNVYFSFKTPPISGQYYVKIDSGGDTLAGINFNYVTETQLDAAELFLQNQINSNDSDITTLQSQVNSNDSDITTLQSQVNSNDSDITTLQSQVIDISASVLSNDWDITTLQSQVIDISASVLSNDSDITTLQSQVIDISASVLSNDWDITTLQSQVITISASVLSISAMHDIDIAKLRADVNTISGDLSGVFGSERTQVQGTTVSLAQDVSGTLDITGYKTYSLMKIETSIDAWVRIYSDHASRIADTGRDDCTDPAPNAGVIAEAITTGAETVTFTPAVIGFNNESPETTTIPLTVTNKNATPQAITITLTLLQLEQ